MSGCCPGLFFCVLREISLLCGAEFFSPWILPMKNTHSLVQLIRSELRLGSDKPAEALIVIVSAIDSFLEDSPLLVTPVKSPCSTMCFNCHFESSLG